MSNFIVIGTWNTKKEELEFVCNEIEKRSHRPIKLDLSTKKISGSREFAINHAVTHAKFKLRKIFKKDRIAGVLSLGGGTNLFMATKIMENIPLFIPKMIVSTMIVNSLHAVRTYKDIIYVQSPCDFGILNPLTKAILTNCVNMLISGGEELPRFDKPSIAITGFGISDGYYTAAKKFWLKKGYHLVPFHSIGENTMAMAELIEKGVFEGVLDLTLHDVMDHVAHGAFGKMDKHRLYAYLSRDIPAVLAPGGVDVIAYIPGDHPSPFSLRNRKIYYHDFRWGIRAEKKEIIQVAKWIGEILEETNPKNSIFLIPLRGWSYPGEKGQKLYDPELIGTFKKWIKRFIREEAVIDVDLSINDPQFGRIACQHLSKLIKNRR